MNPRNALLKHRSICAVLPILTSGLFPLMGCDSPPRMSRAEAIRAAAAQESWRRISVPDVLVHYRDVEAQQALRHLATNSDLEVRGNAIRAIGRDRDSLAIPILVQALDDEGSWKRCEQRGFMFTLFMEPIAYTSNESLTRITGHRVKLAHDAGAPERLTAKRHWETFLASWTLRH